MIIDVHAHLGEDVVFDEATTERELLDGYKKHGVDGAIIQPFICRPYVEDTREAHDHVHRFTQSGEMKLWGMASINPHFRREDYEAEAERCIRELGFVGIKISCIAHACHPSSRDGLHVFEVCRALGVPLMIHTGNGVPFSDPMSAAPAVESFPDVRVVLAHAGSEMHSQQAVYLARKHDNVYLEPSWVGSIGFGNMLSRVGDRKILFSSDYFKQLPIELCKYRSLIESAESFDRIMYKNAVEVYGLKVGV